MRLTSLQTITVKVVLLLLCVSRQPGRTADIGTKGGTVKPGVDVLLQSYVSELRGKRIGLIVNQASVCRNGTRTVDALLSKGLKVAALFAPEHGIDGKYKGGERFYDSRDAATGLPVYSLYEPSGRLAPPMKVLKNLDVLIYDLQDIGIRPFTYISSLGLAIDAAAESKVAFWVLDRPNPLGGLRVEGPVLEPQLQSFVGRWPIPYVYGLTPGELALFLVGERLVKSPYWLKVVPMMGWHRSMTWAETGLNWIPPSPSLQDADMPFYLTATALVAHIGGISVGFGSPWPYQCIAAPRLSSERLVRWFKNKGIQGWDFVPVTFTPTRGAYAGQKVQGVRLEVIDRCRAPLLMMNFYILDAIKETMGRDLYAEAIERNANLESFDKIVGTATVRRGLKEGWNAEDFEQSWRLAVSAYLERRRLYLIYAE